MAFARRRPLLPSHLRQRPDMAEGIGEHAGAIAVGIIRYRGAGQTGPSSYSYILSRRRGGGQMHRRDCFVGFSWLF